MASSVREISARLTLDGEAEWKRQLNDAQRSLRTLDSELRASEQEFRGQANSIDALSARHDTLKRKQEQQREIVEKLAQAVEDAAKEFGENSKKTDELRIKYNNARASLSKLDGELADNEQYLQEAENAADGCATSIDGYGKKVKKVAEESKPAAEKSGLLNTMLGRVNLTGLSAAAMLGKLGSGLVNAIRQIGQMVDETAELRTSLAKLETSAQNAGVAVGADFRDALIEMSGIGIGLDEGMETLTNLFAAGITGGDELSTTLNALNGATIKYQQTLKSESLADSLQEFLASGELTGQFSELLGREGLLTDFNDGLVDCQTQADRTKLTMQMLAASGLEEVSAAFSDANSALVSYNEAQTRLQLAQADYASMFAGEKAALENMKAWLLEGWTSFSLQGFGGGAIISVLAQNAGTTFTELETYLRTNQMSWVEWKQAVADSGMTASEYWADLQTSAAAIQAASDATDAYAAAVEAQVPSVEDALAALDELEAEYNAIRSSVDTAVSGFTNMSTATEQYATTADDMIAALQSQREYLAEYEANLQTVADAGLSDALIAELSDGSAQSAAYLQAIVDGGAGAIEQLNTEFAGVQAGKDAFVETVAALQPEFEAKLTEITTTLDAAVDDWNKYDEAATSGENTINGLVGALQGRISDLIALGRQAGNAFLSGYNQATDQHSPSRKMAQAMDYTVDGAVIEGQKRLADLRRVGASLGGAVLDGYRGAGAASAPAAAGSAAGGSRVEVNIYPKQLDNATVDYLVRRVDSYLGGKA